jgi:hypothetical protein
MTKNIKKALHQQGFLILCHLVATATAATTVITGHFAVFVFFFDFFFFDRVCHDNHFLSKITIQRIITAGDTI